MNKNEILESIKSRTFKYVNNSIVLQKEVEEIIGELAILTGLEKSRIRSAVISQTRFIRDVLRLTKKPEDTDFNLDDYKTILIRRIGKFTPKPTFIKKHSQNTN